MFGLLCQSKEKEREYKGPALYMHYVCVYARACVRDPKDRVQMIISWLECLCVCLCVCVHTCVHELGTP